MEENTKRKTSDQLIIDDVQKGDPTACEMYEIVNQRVEGLESVSDRRVDGGYYQYVFRNAATGEMYGILYTLTAMLIEDLVFQGPVRAAVHAKVEAEYVPAAKAGRGRISVDPHIAQRKEIGAQLVELLKDVDFTF